jgi:hypothetical protein
MSYSVSEEETNTNTVGMEDDLLLQELGPLPLVAPALQRRNRPNYTQRPIYNYEHDALRSNSIPDNRVDEDNTREDFRLGTIEANRIRQEIEDIQRIADMSPYNREHDGQEAVRRMRETRGGRTNKRNKRKTWKTKKTKMTKWRTKRRTNRRK